MRDEIFFLFGKSFLDKDNCKKKLYPGSSVDSGFLRICWYQFVIKTRYDCRFGALIEFLVFFGVSLCREKENAIQSLQDTFPRVARFEIFRALSGIIYEKLLSELACTYFIFILLTFIYVFGAPMAQLYVTILIVRISVTFIFLKRGVLYLDFTQIKNHHKKFKRNSRR